MNNSNHIPQQQGHGFVEEDTISITGILVSLKRYWKLIVLLAGSAIVFLLFASILYYVTNPPRKTVAMRFLLTFDGANDGEYPNGMPFSTAEILSTQVLRQVYDKNELGDYLDFNDFKDALVITRRIPELDRLNQEYSAMLEDTGLSSVARERIISEYEDKKEALMRPEYQISYSYAAGITAPPADVVKKVFYDTLSQWADYAAEKKGALEYAIPVYSANLLRADIFEREDYIVGLSMLRQYLRRMERTVDNLMEIPGVEVVRTEGKNYSLFEIKDFINDMRKHDIEPLYSLIASTRLVQNKQLVQNYMKQRLFSLDSEREAAEERLALAEDSLRKYMRESAVAASPRTQLYEEPERHQQRETSHMIPQLGGDFLDRIFDMARQEHDRHIEYRKEKLEDIIEKGISKIDIEGEYRLYENFYETFTEEPDAEQADAEKEEIANLIESRYSAMVPQLTTYLEQIQDIYRQLSERNLNPQTALYETEPISIRSTFPTRKIMMVNIAIFALFFLITLYACLIHSTYSRQR